MRLRGMSISFRKSVLTVQKPYAPRPSPVKSGK
jgi:hypothetical protein